MELDTTQGTQPDPSAAPQGGSVPVSAGVVDPNLTPLMTDTSADASAAVQGAVQGGGQGQATQPDEITRKIQSEVDKVQAKFLAEKYQLEQRIAQIQQQTQPQTPQNPHDYSTDFPNWFRWEQQQGLRATAEIAQKASMETLQNMIAQANENQWIQTHPNVDVSSLKAFNRMNGIAEWNLEAGYKLMNYPSQMATVAQTASQQTLNNFRQPTGNFAQPVRGNNGGVQAPSFDFKKLVEAAAKNPDIIDALPEADQKEFWAAMGRLRA